METLYRAKKPVQVRGSEYMMLTSIEGPSASSTNLYQGVFARFTEIDPNLPWFNMDSLKEAGAGDLAEVHIPGNLRPNYTPFFFQFDLERHLFIFETRSSSHAVAPLQVEMFLRLLVEQVVPDLAVSVNLVSDTSSISLVLAIPSLKHLRITLELPNPDLNASLEARLRERLRRQNARRLTDELDALPGQSLKPDKATVALARVASANGEVEGFGTEDGLPRRISTKSYPRRESERYDPDAIIERQAFNKAADKAKRGRGRRRRRAPD